MKKIKTISTILLASLTLNACSSNNGITIWKNYDTHVSLLNLEIDEFKNLLNNKYSFVLLTYKQYCSSCSEVEQRVLEYAQNNRACFYEYALDNELEQIKDINEVIYDKIVHKTAITIIKDGEFSYQIPESKIDNIDSLSKTLNNYLTISENIMYQSDEVIVLENGLHFYYGSDESYPIMKTINELAINDTKKKVFFHPIKNGCGLRHVDPLLSSEIYYTDINLINDIITSYFAQ